VPICIEASFGKSAPERNSLRSSGLHHGMENQEKQLPPRFLLSQRKAPTGLEIGDVFTNP
jgi:hypothetical protein